MSKRGKAGRVLAVVGVVVACVLVAFLATRDASNTQARRMIAAEMARLKAMGEPTTIQDLMPTGIPASQNAAEVYKQIFKVMDEVNPPGTTPSASAAILQARYTNPTPGQWTDAAQESAAYDPLIPLLKKAASRPYCRFPLDWTKSVQETHPMFVRFRDFLRVFSVRASVAAKRGDSATALKEVQTGMLASQGLRDEPGLMPFWMSQMMLGSFPHMVRRLLSSADIEEEDAKAFYDALSTVDAGSGFDSALKTERVLDMTLLEAARARPDKYHGTQTFGVTQVSGLYKYGWVEELGYLTYVNKLIEYSSLPYREIANSELRSTAVLDDMLPPVRHRVFWKRPPRHVLADQVAPRLLNAFITRDETTTRIDGTRIFLALKAFKSKYGRYPTNLNELRLKLGWKIPVDVFSGKDFVYSRAGTGFKFYSIGGDLKDNGGRRDGPARSRNSDMIWQAPK